MIIANNLQKKIKNFYALNGLNIHVKKGQIYGFIGKNGAGKTTAMNIFAGLSKATTGKCIVNGVDITFLKESIDLHIGYLPEEPKFYNWMTALETLIYLSKNKNNANEILDLIGLKEHSNRRVSGFSRGMKQRLGIGAALINNPDLLILDEPSSALDPKGRKEVLSLIKRLNEMGKTILFSTHILEDVEKICDTVGFISNGELLFEKNINEIKKNNIKPILDIVTINEINETIYKLLVNLEGVESVNKANTAINLVLSNVDIQKEILKLIVENNITIESIQFRKSKIDNIFT